MLTLCGFSLGVARVLRLQLPHSPARSGVVILSDVMEDLLDVLLGLVGQIGQILDPAIVCTELADIINAKIRSRQVVMHLVYKIAELPPGFDILNHGNR